MRRASAGGDAADRALLGRLDGVRFRPVFIMGSARSGTSILYRLLAMTERFNYVTAYHLVEHDSLLFDQVSGTTEHAKQQLLERFRELGIAGARFDGVEVSPDFPEEYGFHLGPRQQLTPRTLPAFLELCRKVQLTSGRDRPLLLKNPWDSCGFMYIKDVLPESRFIFIHRNPADVVASMLEGMRALLGDRNAYHALLARFYDRLMEKPLRRSLARLLLSSRFGLGVRLVAWQVMRTARYFVDNVRLLPETAYVSIRYEDLCREPGTVIDQVLAFLQVTPNHDVSYQDFIRTRKRRPVADEDGDPAAILRRLELKPYLAYCGYEPE